MKFYLALAGLSFSALIGMNVYLSFYETEAKPIPPAPELSKVHLGYRQIFADAYWLRLIQDLDYCDETPVPLEKTKNPDGRRVGPNRTPSCHLGWGYRMAHVILELDPRFHFVAAMAPVSLSVVADDIAGATRIFKIATDLFSNDWTIHYQAGYHHMVELDDEEGAIRHFSKAIRIGAPRWLPLLLARLQTKAGKKLLAEVTLKNFIRSVSDDSALKERAEEKLKALQKED